MRKKEVFCWAMYDLANTAFSALFVTFFFPKYVTEFLGGNKFQIGLVFGLSMLLVGLLVPVIGAWSDRIRKRMPFIVVFTFFCCAATLLVPFVSLKVALFLGLVANFFYHAALTTYNALIPLLGIPEEYGKISGIGVALGYLGTLLSLGIAALVLNRLGWETMLGVKSVFIVTALFFFVFSLFLFFGVRERGNSMKEPWHAYTHHAIKDVLKTIAHLRKHKGLIPYLITIFMFVDAVTAVIVFLYLYGRSVIGLETQAFMIVYALFALSAVAGSYLVGRLTDTIGPKKTLMLAGASWLVVLGVLLMVQSLPMFIFAGLLGGVAMGAVWTSSRPLLIALSPKRGVGQFFGFSELANKFSGVLGPIAYGFLANFYGDKAAIVSLFVFFIIGLASLCFVPDRRNGSRTAKVIVGLKR
ncbi:MAG: MFS transporter [Candidatus Woesearchaeota archaeon]